MSYCVPLAAPFALEKKGLKHPSKAALILSLRSSAVFIMDCNHLPKEVIILNQLPLLAIATCWAQRQTPWTAHFPQQLPTWILQLWRRFLGSSDPSKKGSLKWRSFLLVVENLGRQSSRKGNSAQKSTKDHSQLTYYRGFLIKIFMLKGQENL